MNHDSRNLRHSPGSNHPVSERDEVWPNDKRAPPDNPTRKKEGARRADSFKAFDMHADAYSED